MKKLIKLKANKRKAEAPDSSHKPHKVVTHDNVRRVNDYCTVLKIQEGNEITCTIGGVKVPIIIDSASSCNIIDDETWKSLIERNSN